jgi:cytochrome P450
MSPSFKHDPLGWLDDAASDGRGVRRISRREICIYHAEVARTLLRNESGRMVEHSDFFGDGPGSLAPRSAQVAVAREAYALVHEHVLQAPCDQAVSALGRSSKWPRAGTTLLFDLMKPALAALSRSAAFHAALNNMVAARIHNRHEPPIGFIRRFRDRLGFYRATLAEAANSGGPGAERRDVLDIIQNFRCDMDDEALVQLYAGFVFATVGSIGFTLGWSVLQAAMHQRTQQHPAFVVMEALRLHPIAWLLQRRVRKADVILGEPVEAGHAITISPYALHRNPAYWPDPTEFLPERWSSIADRSAWLPFGAGGHGCIAAGLSVSLASRILSEILRRDPSVEIGDPRPSLGAALAPPRFTLKLGAS